MLKRLSTTKALLFLSHRTFRLDRLVPGFRRSMTCGGGRGEKEKERVNKRRCRRDRQKRPIVSAILNGPRNCLPSERGRRPRRSLCNYSRPNCHSCPISRRNGNTPFMPRPTGAQGRTSAMPGSEADHFAVDGNRRKEKDITQRGQGRAEVGYSLHAARYRASHLVVDLVWLTWILIVPLSAQLCLGW